MSKSKQAEIYCFINNTGKTNVIISSDMQRIIMFEKPSTKYEQAIRINPFESFEDQLRYDVNEMFELNTLDIYRIKQIFNQLGWLDVKKIKSAKRDGLKLPKKLRNLLKKGKKND